MTTNNSFTFKHGTLTNNTNHKLYFVDYGETGTIEEDCFGEADPDFRDLCILVNEDEASKADIVFTLQPHGTMHFDNPFNYSFRNSWEEHYDQDCMSHHHETKEVHYPDDYEDDLSYLFEDLGI